MTLFRKTTALFIVLTICCSAAAFSQTNIKSKEAYFAKLYSKLTSFIQQDYDSIGVYSDKFGKEFTSFIENNPVTLNYSFKRLIDSNFCFVKTSTDGNFRIYSWDTWTGGTMHVFKTMYQWRSDGEVFTKIDEDDPGSFCSKIFKVNINDKPCYFAVTNGIYSTKVASQSISAFAIEDKTLTDTLKVFKAKSKMLNRIDVEFDFFSVVDRPERPLELIKYDDKRNLIYIPVVNEHDQVTKKNLVYQPKGSYFEFVGTETGIRKSPNP